MTGESQYFLGADIAGRLFRTLGGIRSDPERPGFKHVILRPQPCGDLKWVKSSFHSPYGPISSAWEITRGRIKWDVTVPPNTTATAHVPTANPATVTESGKPAARAVHELTSGVYTFEAEWR